MRPIRIIVSELFVTPIQNMSFVAYFQYLNSAGKMTARTHMDLTTILLVAYEEVEKKLEAYESNFKEIQEILEKLTEKQKNKEATIEELKAALTVLPKLAQSNPQMSGYAENIQASGGSGGNYLGGAGGAGKITTLYPCKKCDMKFSKPIQLAIHSKTHKTSSVTPDKK